jgi:hypothetical protein
VGALAEVAFGQSVGLRLPYLGVGAASLVGLVLILARPGLDVFDGVLLDFGGGGTSLSLTHAVLRRIC